MIKRNKLSNHVFFIGPIDQNEVAYQLKKANVYVLTSFIENSPNSLLEAMSIGTPLVASYVGGVPDYIHSGVNGFLYTSTDSYMLASYVVSLFSCPELCQRFSKEERIKSLQVSNKDKIVKDMEGIYEIVGNSNKK